MAGWHRVLFYLFFWVDDDFPCGGRHRAFPLGFFSCLWCMCAPAPPPPPKRTLGIWCARTRAIFQIKYIFKKNGTKKKKSVGQHPFFSVAECRLPLWLRGCFVFWASAPAFFFFSCLVPLVGVSASRGALPLALPLSPFCFYSLFRSRAGQRRQSGEKKRGVHDERSLCAVWRARPFSSTREKQRRAGPQGEHKKGRRLTSLLIAQREAKKRTQKREGKKTATDRDRTPGTPRSATVIIDKPKEPRKKRRATARKRPGPGSFFFPSCPSLLARPLSRVASRLPRLPCSFFFPVYSAFSLLHEPIPLSHPYR